MSETTTPVPDLTIPGYAAPRVAITPVSHVISQEPIDQHGYPGHYQHVLLDVRSGELCFHESTQHLERWEPEWSTASDVPADRWKEWHPGTGFTPRGPHMWFEPVPALLSWTVDSGKYVQERPYLDVAAANALLEQIAPYAQALLDGLSDVADDLDWSAAAVRAGRNIGRLCSRHGTAAPAEADADVADFAAVVARFPEVYRPELLRLSLEKLAKECEWITRFLGSDNWSPQIKKVFGLPYADGSGVGLDVVGARAWYRTALLAGDPRRPLSYDEWETEHGALTRSGITATSTEAAIAAWVNREENVAARAGVRLLGIEDAADAYRATLRQQVWDQLAIVGADVARLERELAEARTTRQALVTQVITWQPSDAAIGERGRMSRQAVHNIRTGAEDASGTA